MPRISLIVAMDEAGLIGRDNDLPWRLSNDLRNFKQITMGKPIIMGRKCYESIGKPLPGRQNIVITRNADWTAVGCTVVASLDAAIAAAGDVEEVMIIGGAQIYALALPSTERLYLTRVHTRLEGDVRFPQFDLADWQQISCEPHAADDRNEWPHSFLVFDRS